MTELSGWNWLVTLSEAKGLAGRLVLLSPDSSLTLLSTTLISARFAHKGRR